MEPLKIILRDYQSKLIDEIKAEMLNDDRVLVVAPTGSGKTVVFSYIISQIIAKGKTAFVVSNRNELLTQADGSFRKFGVHPYTIDSYSTTIPKDRQIYNCMVQSLFNRIDQMPEPDLIILDEAHLADHKKVMSRFPNTKTLGFTATPVAASRKDPLNNWFTGYVSAPGIPTMIDRKYLEWAKMFGANQHIDGLKKSGGDYSGTSQTKFFTKKEVITNAFDLWNRAGGDLKTIAFCSSIKHSENMAREWQDRGITAASVTTKNTKAQRLDILERFKKGDIQVLFNCGILTTGYDEPTIQHVLLLRRTTSLALYMQMCGRGSRLAPGKAGFVITDIGGSWAELGVKWDDNIDWETMFRHPKTPKSKLTQGGGTKLCPWCYYMLSISAKKCLDCDWVMPEASIKEITADLISISQKEFNVLPIKPEPTEEMKSSLDPELVIANIRYTKLIRGHNENWVFREVYRILGKAGLTILANKRNYDSHWVSRTVKRLKK